MNSFRCSRCDAEVPPDARFCPACGLPQPVHELHPTDTLPALQLPAVGDVPVMIVTRGANAGSKFALDESTVTIGRHPDSTIFLDDVTVSRRHATIERRDDVFEVADAGSLNGTYVNGKRIDRAQLNEGDQVQIGKYKLIYATEAT